MIGIHRRGGGRETWLATAKDLQNIEISLESTARLSDDPAAPIDELAGEPT